MSLKHVQESTKIYRHHGGRWSVHRRIKKHAHGPSDYAPILIRVTTAELNKWLDNKCANPPKNTSDTPDDAQAY